MPNDYPFSQGNHLLIPNSLNMMEGQVHRSNSFLSSLSIDANFDVEVESPCAQLKVLQESSSTIGGPQICF